jgi:hypothetical protein
MLQFLSSTSSFIVAYTSCSRSACCRVLNICDQSAFLRQATCCYRPAILSSTIYPIVFHLSLICQHTHFLPLMLPSVHPLQGCSIYERSQLQVVALFSSIGLHLSFTLRRWTITCLLRIPLSSRPLMGSWATSMWLASLASFLRSSVEG